MDSKAPTDQTQTPATNSAPIVLTTQGGRIIRPVPGIKCLSITITVLASLLAVLGILAVTIKARSSYVGNPIWTGLLILLPTGILGIFVYKKNNNMCTNIAFLVMSIISSVFLFQAFYYAMGTAANEWFECLPYAYSSHNLHTYYYAINCPPEWSRILVGVVITLCALVALVLSIVSCSLTMYGTFQCCYMCCNCCRKNTSLPMVQYSPTTGVLMAPGSGQPMQVIASTPQMMPPGTQQPDPSSQPLLVASPQPVTPNASYMAAPNVSSSIPTQTTLVPGNQQFTSEASTVSSGDQPSGSVQVVQEKKTDNPPGGQIADNPKDWQQF